MAENENSQEKTEQPSQKRLDDSKKKGQVARSKEFNVLLCLLASAILMLMTGNALMSNLIDSMTQGLSLRPEVTKNSGYLAETVISIAKPAFLGVIPLLTLSIVAIFAGPILIGGWAMSAENITPKFERFDPIKGLGRLFSMKSLVELGKSVLKVVLIAGVALAVVYSMLPDFIGLVSGTPRSSLGTLGELLLTAFFALSAVLVLIAAIDVPYQLWHHKDQLMMTLQEVKDEMKESDGRPEVKSKRRQMQMDLSDKRMMEAVPTADVIITNPTHYAVALRYEDGLSNAPIVVAKGRDWIALKIREVAKANDVPIFEAPPLARALHGMAKINQEIPADLYEAVAQVLAYIYQLKKVTKPQDKLKKPTTFNVPDTYMESEK
jgi:flagellar biosynthesis protein FlhB